MFAILIYNDAITVRFLSLEKKLWEFDTQDLIKSIDNFDTKVWVRFDRSSIVWVIVCLFSPSRMSNLTEWEYVIFFNLYVIIFFNFLSKLYLTLQILDTRSFLSQTIKEQLNRWIGWRSYFNSSSKWMKRSRYTSICHRCFVPTTH